MYVVTFITVIEHQGGNGRGGTAAAVSPWGFVPLKCSSGVEEPRAVLSLAFGPISLSLLRLVQGFLSLIEVSLGAWSVPPLLHYPSLPPSSRPPSSGVARAPQRGEEAAQWCRKRKQLTVFSFQLVVFNSGWRVGVLGCTHRLCSDRSFLTGLLLRP